MHVRLVQVPLEEEFLLVIGRLRAGTSKSILAEKEAYYFLAASTTRLLGKSSTPVNSAVMLLRGQLLGQTPA